MATNRDAKKLACISDADTTLFWIERPAILFIIILYGFETVLPFIVLLGTNLAYFFNSRERRRINPNHQIDGDLMWFCDERVAMLFAAVSLLGYPVLESVAIFLFFTTNFMYIFIPIFQYNQLRTASETQQTNRARDKTIQMKELIAEIDVCDDEHHQNQQASNQDTVCSDGQEWSEIISDQSTDTAGQNFEGHDTEWRYGEGYYYYDNKYSHWKNYVTKYIEKEFRVGLDQEDYFRDFLEKVSSKNIDDRSNSWEPSGVYERDWVERNQEASDQGTVCSDDQEDSEIISDKSSRSASHNLEESNVEWRYGDGYYENKYIHFKNYDDEDSENEFRAGLGREYHFWNHFNITSSSDGSDSGEVSGDCGSYVVEDIVSSSETSSVFCEEEDDEKSMGEMEKQFVNSTPEDATIQWLEVMNFVFRLLENQNATFSDEKDELLEKLESATQSSEKYKEERDELSAKLRTARLWSEYHRKVSQEYEEQCWKLEEEKKMLSWELDVANETAEWYRACCSRILEKNSQR